MGTIRKISEVFNVFHNKESFFAGIFGMKLIVDALIFACDKKNIYPQIGVSVFRVWVIILAFVGIQLAWSLRPFLGDKNGDFILFRKYQGNFYTAIIYSFDQLISGSEVENDKKNAETEIVPNQQKDSADFSYFLEK